MRRARGEEVAAIHVDGLKGRLAAHVEERAVVCRAVVADLDGGLSRAIAEHEPDKVPGVHARKDHEFLAADLLVDRLAVERDAVEGEVGHERDAGEPAVLGEALFDLAPRRSGAQPEKQRYGGESEHPEDHVRGHVSGSQQGFCRVKGHPACTGLRVRARASAAEEDVPVRLRYRIVIQPTDSVARSRAPATKGPHLTATS